MIFHQLNIYTTHDKYSNTNNNNRCLTGWNLSSSNGFPGCWGWTGLEDHSLLSLSCSGCLYQVEYQSWYLRGNTKNFSWQILWQLEHGNNMHYSIFNIQISNFNSQMLVFSCRQRLWQLDKGDKPNNSGLVTPGEFETLSTDILERRVLVSSYSFLRGDRCNIPENPYWF